MKFKQALTVKEVAEIIDCSFVGNERHLVVGLNEIHRVETGDLVFVDHPKYYEKALNSAGSSR